jgi:hypothetical protein
LDDIYQHSDALIQGASALDKGKGWQHFIAFQGSSSRFQ